MFLTAFSNDELSNSVSICRTQLPYILRNFSSPMKSRYFIIMLLAFSFFFGTFLITLISNKPKQPTNLEDTISLPLDHLKIDNTTAILFNNDCTTTKNDTIENIDNFKTSTEKVITGDHYFENNDVCKDFLGNMLSSAACSMLNVIRLEDNHSTKDGNECQIKDQLKRVGDKLNSRNYESALNELKCITCLYNKINNDPEHKGKVSKKCHDEIVNLHGINTFEKCFRNHKKYNDRIGIWKACVCCFDIRLGNNHSDLRILPLDQIFLKIGEVCNISADETDYDKLYTHRKTKEFVEKKSREENVITAVSKADDDLEKVSVVPSD